jgi:hypothetical protein
VRIHRLQSTPTMAMLRGGWSELPSSGSAAVPGKSASGSQARTRTPAIRTPSTSSSDPASRKRGCSTGPRVAGPATHAAAPALRPDSATGAGCRVRRSTRCRGPRHRGQSQPGRLHRPATKDTSIERRTQARPARYMTPANDTTPPASATRSTDGALPGRRDARQQEGRAGSSPGRRGAGTAPCAPAQACLSQLWAFGAPRLLLADF